MLLIMSLLLSSFMPPAASSLAADCFLLGSPALCPRGRCSVILECLFAPWSEENICL
jgi:hypothetical protein